MTYIGPTDVHEAQCTATASVPPTSLVTTAEDVDLVEDGGTGTAWDNDHGSQGLPGAPRLTREHRKSGNLQHPAPLHPDLLPAETVLRKLKDHAMARPFLTPVDPVKLGIPDYFDIIKNPMDLQTLSDNLSRGKYNHMEEFEEDLQLIWDNCFLYNPPTNEVVRMATVMEYYSKKLLDSVRESKGAAQPPPPPCPPPASKILLTSGRPIEMATSTTSASRSFPGHRLVLPTKSPKAAALITRGDRLKAPTAPKRSIMEMHHEETGHHNTPCSQRQGNRLMPSHGRETLCAVVRSALEPQYLVGVLEILTRACPQCIVMQGSELELDFSELDDQTTFALQLYVADCLDRQRRASQSRTTTAAFESLLRAYPLDFQRSCEPKANTTCHKPWTSQGNDHCTQERVARGRKPKCAMSFTEPDTVERHRRLRGKHHKITSKEGTHQRRMREERRETRAQSFAIKSNGWHQSNGTNKVIKVGCHDQTPITMTTTNIRNGRSRRIRPCPTVMEIEETVDSMDPEEWSTPVPQLSHHQRAESKDDDAMYVGDPPEPTSMSSSFTLTSLTEASADTPVDILDGLPGATLDNGHLHHGVQDGTGRSHSMEDMVAQDQTSVSSPSVTNGQDQAMPSQPPISPNLPLSPSNPSPLFPAMSYSSGVGPSSTANQTSPSNPPAAMSPHLRATKTSKAAKMRKQLHPTSEPSTLGALHALQEQMMNLQPVPLPLPDAIPDHWLKPLSTSEADCLTMLQQLQTQQLVQPLPNIHIPPISMLPPEQQALQQYLLQQQQQMALYEQQQLMHTTALMQLPAPQNWGHLFAPAPPQPPVLHAQMSMYLLEQQSLPSQKRSPGPPQAPPVLQPTEQM